ncbi:MAG: hypothetical protein K5751_07965 [Treponemataceae bacterium]|nr:hypothetical protein [Treponemataceae bacterium]
MSQQDNSQQNATGQGAKPHNNKSQNLNAQQKEFFDFFEGKTGFRPEKMELVSVSGTRSSLKTLGLELPTFQKDLWGLLLYCGEKLFFYIHPTEYSYMGLVRKGSSDEMKIEEQLVCFSDFASFSVSVPMPRFHILKFFSNNHILTVSVTKQTVTGETETAVIQMQSLTKASVLQQKLQPFVR